ncbi:MAG TPA: thiamine pyrophosphate-requiring protein [Chloroflexota bacterium]|nr:thiamine pyrophosphate-requiring protein [Chloroflexota bacterium]
MATTSTRTAGMWTEVPAEEYSDAVVAAMALGGIDYLFFTSGSEIMFYQEALAKAKALGRPGPRMVTMTHEHPNLCAAIGYSMYTGKPAATAVHVDVGTQHYGGAIHTASRGNVPVLITAGAPPTAYAGSMRGARDGPQFVQQQTWDQNGIVRQYMKWDHRLEYQDNPGLIVSRALQVALSEPQGPAYLSLPREVAMLPLDGARFPTAAQLGISRRMGPDLDAVREAADILLRANNPVVVVSRSGRNPATLPALVRLCELLGMGVAEGIWRTYQSFPYDHPLYQNQISLADADAVLVLESDVPWMPGARAPRPEATVIAIDVEPTERRIPVLDLTADLRIPSDSLLAIEALEAEIQGRLTAADRQRAADRTARWADASRTRRAEAERAAQAVATRTPIDPAWLSYQIGQALDDNCVVVNDTTGASPVFEHIRLAGPRAAITNPGSSGGFGPGAALGVKLAAPERDVVVVTGDGFYTFAVPTPAIWAAVQQRAPFMTVIYQNRSWGTGTRSTQELYPGGYAAKGGFEGGYFDPPIDFAREAEAAGAYGENVRDPAEVGPALRRGLQQIRNGTPAVIAVWLPKILQDS